MKHALKHIEKSLMIPVLTSLAIVGAGYSHQAVAKVSSFKAATDSSYIMMGNTTALKFSLIADKADSEGIFSVLKDSVPAQIEFRSDSVPDILRTDLGNNRVELKGEYIIQSFDSGDYRIPELMYTVNGDTVYSNAQFLKVVPVDVAEDQEICTEASVMSPGSGFFDWLPSWWFWPLIGIAIIAAGVFAYLIMSKRVVIKLPAKKPEPPYEVARKQLNELREEKMWDSALDKTYYTRLTDIIRTYLQGRFGINAMELTSSQIIASMKELDLSKEEISSLQKLFVTSDFVKFAKMQPMREENIASFNIADQFVESTRPVEQPVEENPSTEAPEIKK